jgi:hypothetical protein
MFDSYAALARPRNASPLGVVMLSTLITGLDGRSNFERNGGAIGSPSYRCSEVIHRSGDESPFSAFERERPQIVNNFAVGALPGYE